MGFWNKMFMAWLAGREIGKARADPEPIIIDSDQLTSNKWKWYDLWTDARQTCDIRLTIHGPPIGVELLSSPGFQRRKRGEPAEPVIAKHGVNGDVRLNPKVGEGQYVLVLYREEAEISRHDIPTKEAISDYELTVRFQ